MKIYILLILVFCFSCVEAKKAGDNNRVLIKKTTSVILQDDPENPEKKALDDAAKENLEDPPTVLGEAGKVTAKGIVASAPFWQSASGGSLITLLIGLTLQGAKMYNDSKKKAQELELQAETNKLLPKENHELYASCKEEAVKKLTLKKGKIKI